MMPEHLFSKTKLKGTSDSAAVEKVESPQDWTYLRTNERHIALWPRRWCFLILTIRKDAEVLCGRLDQASRDIHVLFQMECSSHND
jgi:hypothetical protein